MTPKYDLTSQQKFVLEWLSKEDVSSYGECRGRDLDVLIGLGLAKTAVAPTDYSGVSLTDSGYKLAADLRETRP